MGLLLAHQQRHDLGVELVDLFLHPSDPLPNLTQRQREAYDALAHGADSTTWARNASISADYAREIVAGLAKRMQVEGQTGVRLHFLARLWETLA
jgi:hypothetical protein